MNSVTPLTATSRGSQNALSKDVEGLVNTLATNGGGIDVVFIAAPAQAAAMRLWAGPHFSFPILASAALANGTVVAVEASSFVSGFGPGAAVRHIRRERYSRRGQRALATCDPRAGFGDFGDTGAVALANELRRNSADSSRRLGTARSSHCRRQFCDVVNPMDYERAAAIAADDRLAKTDERLADVESRVKPHAPPSASGAPRTSWAAVGQISRVEWDAYCQLGKPPLEINQRKIAPVAPPPAPQPEPDFTPEMIDALGAVIAGERQRMRQHVEQELAAGSSANWTSAEANLPRAGPSWAGAARRHRGEMLLRTEEPAAARIEACALTEVGAWRGPPRYGVQAYLHLTRAVERHRQRRRHAGTHAGRPPTRSRPRT